MKSKLYRKILLATDDSESARKAADAALELAHLSGAKIYAVYVIDRSIYSSVPEDLEWEEAMYTRFRELGEEAVSYMEKAAKDTDLQVESVLLEGHPAEEIVNFAEKNGMDLIIIGSLGKSKVERFLIGSISEKVIRNSKVPVLVVHWKRP
ncbi:TPA: universal stress protein [Methanosarcina acetivorans]|uniref:Universal stress protein n=3 Tax=Methanosarcina TaxID=2207 RepID=Q8TUB1_METAC|nr:MULTISPECIES: universal stress protein [Methanosarcina]AAM03615.1 universal stress protein [Methanosarcina acetivorans C2A]AKB26854.1 Universal stress protein [Methanosarcina siciliae T4/M]HIH94128.1 universal stress protein [Methanosarcina acetivorans]